MFGLRSKLANWMFHAAERIAPPRGAEKKQESVQSLPMEDPVSEPDLCPEATEEERPSARALAIADRVQFQSLRTMQAELMDGLAAFYAAHCSGAALWREREMNAWTDIKLQRSGTNEDEAVQLTQVSAAWQADAARIQAAAEMLGAINVEATTLTNCMGATEAERELLDQCIEAVAVGHAREMLKSQEALEQHKREQ